MKEFTIRIIHDEDGYVAYVPTMPGCITQGDTLEEVLKNIGEAIELWIETGGNCESGNAGVTLKGKGGQNRERQN